MDNNKELASNILVGIISAVVGGIVVAVVLGQPLSGLSRLRGWVQFFNTGIPLWVFLIVLAIAVAGILNIARSRNRSPLHAVWDIRMSAPGHSPSLICPDSVRGWK